MYEKKCIKMLKILQAGLGVSVLIVGISQWADGYYGQDSPNCRGNSQASSASNVITTPSGPAASSFKPHSVRLSWNASVPANDSLADVIQGYNVYRRDPGKEYEKINTNLIRGTTCIDYFVKAGQTYYYETKAVSARGAVSEASPEVKAVIPSQ